MCVLIIFIFGVNCGVIIKICMDIALSGYRIKMADNFILLAMNGSYRHIAKSQRSKLKISNLEKLDH